MTYPGSDGPWPGDPAEQNPAQQPPPYGQQPPPYGQQPPPYGQQPPAPDYGQPPPPYGQPPPDATTVLPQVPPAYGAPPAYGQQPPVYGQAGGYGAPPVPPGYGTPYGPQPPSSGGSKTPLIAAIVVVLLIAGGVTTYFLTRSDSKPKHQAGKSQQASTSASSSGFPSTQASDSGFPTTGPTDTGFGTDSGVPTDGSSGSSSDVTETAARKIIVQYINDVNAQDRNDAATIICPEVVTSWRNSIDKPKGDFTVTVDSATFEGSEPASPGLDLKYSLAVKDNASGATATSHVTFTVVDESGLKICGEK